MNIEALRGHIPDQVIAELGDVITKFQINTPLRMAHFLAQCAHESGRFHSTVENLNYSADGLKRTFKKYFLNEGLAEKYARKPELIASHVYANRMGNGDESTHDGWKYRGRGYIQITGKNNYAAFDKHVDEDVITNPDVVATKYPLTSAAWFFNSHGVNTIADRGATTEVITAVTKIINGGTNGLDDRISYFKKYYPLLSA